MTNSKSTKRALLASVLSVVMCVAMLVGTTFAWFTDSVTSGKNVIQSGNLDVELEYTTDFKTWTSVDGKTDLFDADALWEPGHAEVVYLRLKNAGSLALKYKFALNIDAETNGTNVHGDTFALSDYLKYGVVEDQQAAFADRAEAIDAVKSPTALTAYSKEGNMEATADAQYLAIVVYMPTDVGNEANYRGNTAPSIDLSLSLIAAQDTVESDSFDNQYDKNAEYPVVTQSDFEAALEQMDEGDTLKLSAGTFKMPEANYDLPAGVSIIGEEGAEIQVDHETNASGLLLKGDNITLSNVKITSNSSAGDNYVGLVKITGNNVTLDNVTISAGYGKVISPIVIGDTSEDNVITIKNSTITSQQARAIYIVDGANGTVNIENCESKGLYPISTNSGNSQKLVLNVSDSKLYGWLSYGDIKSASFTNTVFGKGNGYQFMRPYADTTYTNCTFEAGYKVGAGATGKTYTINNCTAGGVQLTAENVESQLLDMSGTDEANLMGCTIVVDSFSMTPGETVAP